MRQTSAAVAARMSQSLLTIDICDRKLGATRVPRHFSASALAVASCRRAVSIAVSAEGGIGSVRALNSVRSSSAAPPIPTGGVGASGQRRDRPDTDRRVAPQRNFKEGQIRKTRTENYFLATITSAWIFALTAPSPWSFAIAAAACSVAAFSLSGPRASISFLTGVPWQ